jgi:flagellar biogenesis protein FliO
MSTKKINALKVILSVLSSFIGIQSEKNHERDFSARSPLYFIIIGILMTLLFIIALYYFVNNLISFYQ